VTSSIRSALGIRRVRYQWSRLGRRDPLWAVLTAHATRRGGWDTAAFFATGRAEITQCLGELDVLGCAPPRGCALDFGCGVGRLSQALADQFAAVDAVDISEPMIGHARHYNRHPDRCSYHVNDRADLAIFADQRFDFIYSVLVLQHMPLPLATGYITEFVRVLSADGVLVFQVAERDTTLRSRLTAPIPAWLRSIRTGFEMHGIPEATVAATIVRAGASIVSCSREPTPNRRWQNVRFVVQRAGAPARQPSRPV